MIRTHMRRYLVGALVLAVAGQAHSQSLDTFAGGRLMDNLPALEASVNPDSLASTPDGTIYVVDWFYHRLLRRDPVTSLLFTMPPAEVSQLWNSIDRVFFGPTGTGFIAAGGVLYQFNPATGGVVQRAPLDRTPAGPCTQYAPRQFAVDSTGAIYYTDNTYNSICKLSLTLPFPIVSSNAGFGGDGGWAGSALINSPQGIAVDAADNVYFSDTNNNRVRKITKTTGIITTVAGTGQLGLGGENLPAATTRLATPAGLAIDASGNIFIAETANYRVRRINAQTGLISTVAGNGQQVTTPTPDGVPATQNGLGYVDSIAIHSSGDLLLSDDMQRKVRRVARDTGIISTAAGNSLSYFCGDSSAPRDACLDYVRGVVVDTNGDVYISDSNNRRVRKVSAATGMLTTIAGRTGTNQYQGEGGPAINAAFPAEIAGLALDASGNLYVAGGYGGRLYRISKTTGIITTVAGSGVNGFAGDGGPATAARTNFIYSVAVDSTGNIFFSDHSNHRVRKVAAGTGIITTVAGNGLNTGPIGDGGPATAASLSYPMKVGFDGSGNLLIVDYQHNRVRKVDKTTGIITTVIGNGTFGATGDGGPATAASTATYAFSVDAGGNIFILDGGVRRVDAVTGIITTIPNVPNRSPEGFWLSSVGETAFDAAGRMYTTSQQAVLRISGLPVVTPDNTPPVIQPNITGTGGHSSWYRSDVHLSWTVSDAESTVSSSSGCTANSVTSDTTGVTFTCSATSLGGTATQSITIRRDTVAPTLTFGAPTPEPGASGWNSTDVSIPFTADDALSGVFSTSSGSPVTITGEGTGLTEQVVVTDAAGNSGTFTTPVFNIDRSAPQVTANVSGSMGTNGWYTSDVQVSWSTVDLNSPIESSEGCDASSVTTDTADVTFTCTATSAGGSTTQSVTIKRDATAPQLEFAAPSPTANALGWHSGDVSIPFTTSDATSGVATTSTSNPLLITGLGANLSSDVVVTDSAGNSATFPSPAVNIDRSPPAVTANILGTLGANEWYTSDIQVAWTTSGEHAPLDSISGCDTNNVVADTAGVTFGCTAISAGGSTTKSVTVKRDATPPQLAFGAPSPSPNAVGWFAGDVSFAFDATDAMSGVASTSSSSPVVITGDGANLGAQVMVTDGAGNSATFNTSAVSIDRSPPTVQATVAGNLGANGWYTNDVQVSWAVNESPASVVSSNGCETSNVTTDTAGATFTCIVVSGGGTASSSVTVKRDATPPVLTFGTPSPAPNVNGWNKTNVSIPFTRSDALSGLASTSTASPLVINSEGTGVTGQVVVTDNAGNAATFTSVPRNIDKVAPIVSITAPANGVTYGFYQDVIGDYICTDNVSLQSCVGPTASGQPVNTRTAGARTFKVTGKDAVPLTTAVTHSFTVVSSFNFEGFLAPASEPPTLNLVARGSLVPVRWRLPDGNGGYVTNTASFTSATVGSLTCGSATVVPLNDTANGPSGISFDAGTNTFTYNWQTNASWTGCRKLTIKLKDNSLHELRFRFN